MSRPTVLGGGARPAPFGGQEKKDLLLPLTLSRRQTKVTIFGQVERRNS
jgi:hypothetical protein